MGKIFSYICLIYGRLSHISSSSNIPSFISSLFHVIEPQTSFSIFANFPRNFSMAYRHRGSCINGDMKVVNRQRWPISRGSQSKCNRRGSRSGVTWQHNRSTAELNISLEADGGVTLCNRFYPFDISNRASLRLPRCAPNSVPVFERRFSRHWAPPRNSRVWIHQRNFHIWQFPPSLIGIRTIVHRRYLRGKFQSNLPTLRYVSSRTILIPSILSV